MKVLDPGHTFELASYSGSPPDDVAGFPNVLKFMKREGPGYPGNVGHYEGTNCQEVLRALISRVKYLDTQVACEHNQMVLLDLRHALWLFERRAAARHGREVRFFHPNWAIEDEPTCRRCGHIECTGNCKR